MDLWEAVGAERGSVVSLIGAGGKTTSTLALAERASALSLRVLITTTTKIWYPSFPLLLAKDGADIDRELAAMLAHHPIVAAGRSVSDDGKLIGLGPSEVCCLQAPDVVLCEADGAAGRSVKIHRQGEPVVPPCTTHLLVIAGLDALGRPIHDVAHPVPESCEYFGKPDDAAIGEDDVVAALAEGAAHGPAGSALLFLLNKADGIDTHRSGSYIAEQVLSQYPAASVVLTSRGEVQEKLSGQGGTASYTRP